MDHVQGPSGELSKEQMEKGPEMGLDVRHQHRSIGSSAETEPRAHVDGWVE